MRSSSWTAAPPHRLSAPFCLTHSFVKSNVRKAIAATVQVAEDRPPARCADDAVPKTAHALRVWEKQL